MSDDTDEPTTYYERAYSIREHETKDFYARWAATYDEELVGGRGYAMPGRCAAAFATHVTDRSLPVIDLGCGTGLLASRLRELGHTAIDGIDYSPEMLAEAEKTGAYRSLWSADLNEPLAVDDGAYGAVAIMGVFSFGHVHAGALDEFRRILAPGGQMIIGVNEVFVEEGSLVATLDRMHADRLLDVHVREYGDHMPASEVNGWVYVATRIGP
ncbi:MAG: class I SAM-dependent methyltransferase [Actinomycetota bacterium]